MTKLDDLPPLDGFTREQLYELVRVLHGAVCRAHSDYTMLQETTQRAISTLETVAGATVGA